MPLNIRFLFFQECPNSQPAWELLRRTLREEGLREQAVERVEVADRARAEREGFLGSPSIQINGRDIETARAGDAPCFGCRIYQTPDGPSGVPPVEMIRSALRQALGGKAQTMAEKTRILFLCTGNSCRSQMAEGWARALKAGEIEAWSAGIEKHGLNPRAVQVMAEAGVDISGHTSKTVSELPQREFDYVVTVCGHANEHCPIFPGKARIVHVGFDDPPKLAQGAKTEEEALAHYRRVRDEIKAFIETLPGGLTSR